VAGRGGGASPCCTPCPDTHSRRRVRFFFCCLLFSLLPPLQFSTESSSSAKSFFWSVSSRTPSSLLLLLLMPLLLLPPSSTPLALLRLLDVSPLVFFAFFSLAADSYRTSSSVLSALSCRWGVLVLAPRPLDVDDVVEAGETSPATPDSLLPLLQACDFESHRRLPSGLAAGPWDV
jgi:hypothetical protein